jgi:hypothetical protein
MQTLPDCAKLTRDDNLRLLRMLIWSAGASTFRSSCLEGIHHDLGHLIERDLEGNVAAETKDYLEWLSTSVGTLALVQKTGLGIPVPMQVADAVRQAFASARIGEAKTTFALDDHLSIHGWQGAGRSIVQEILEGLSCVLKRRMDLLPAPERLCDITLRIDKEDSNGSVVLTVEVGSEGSQPMNELPYAQSLITQHICRLAWLLSNGWNNGWASTDERGWQVAFPLWLGDNALNEPRHSHERYG